MHTRPARMPSLCATRSKLTKPEAMGQKKSHYKINDSQKTAVHCVSDPASATHEHSGPTSNEEDSEKPTFLKRVRNFLFGGPLDRERLKALGLGFMVSYGFVSNVSYGACITIGWASYVATTGVTPIAGGQWGAFMLSMAGLLALQQLLRPVRFSVAMALTPAVDRMMSYIRKRFNCNERNAVIAMFGILAVFTLGTLSLALTLATVINMPSGPLA